MSNFARFCAFEKEAGGPDPHAKLLAAMVDPATQWWAAGCYGGPYNVAGAWAIYSYWSPRAVLKEPERLERWLRTNWAGIPMRRERKAIRSPAKMARYLESYADWMRTGPEWVRPVGDPAQRYEEAFRDINENVYGVGRYIALKMLEYLTRHAGAPIEAVGIHAKGGWSPREGLALLYPELGLRIKTDDHAAEDSAAMALMTLELEYDVVLTWSELQALLCDYKQCIIGKRQYPGRSVDSELKYAAVVKDAFPDLDFAPFDRGRAMLFPAWALGERQGWNGPRNELGRVLAEHGYMWTDSRLCYTCSRDRLADPVTWDQNCEHTRRLAPQAMGEA